MEEFREHLLEESLAIDDLESPAVGDPCYGAITFHCVRGVEHAMEFVRKGYEAAHGEEAFVIVGVWE
jgi:hypothetical protein